MPSESNLKLCRLFDRDKRANPATNASIAPAIDEAESHCTNELTDKPANEAIDDALYDGLDWTRVPHLEKCQYEHARGAPSWIYRYGWPVYHHTRRRYYWLCSYCHIHKKPGGKYDASSTSGAAHHLGKLVHGHGVSATGLVRKDRDPNQGSLVAHMRDSGVEVLQAVANEISASFTKRRFQDALKDWIAADNQSLRVIETPTFRRLIQAANPLAEAVLWRSHQSLRNTTVAEYYSYIPAV
jgi:hypothetical protein